jgi:uncharacterized Fe-S center protein
MTTVHFLPVGLKHVTREKTLTARYDRLLEQLIAPRMVKGRKVAVKVHMGGDQTYTTNHPTFIRRTVMRIRDAGGDPFLVDSRARYNPDCGYTYDTLGCLVFPAAGLHDKYVYRKKTRSHLLPEVEIGGFIHDTDVLVNLSHAKGHGHCAYGGAIKNLAMGAVTDRTRRETHSVMGAPIAWDRRRCKRCGVCIEHCRGRAMRFRDGELVVDSHSCMYCGRCLALCPTKALRMDEGGWTSFQHALALTAREVARPFEPDRILHINIALQITALCDCFGMGQPSLTPDVGIIAGRDIVAVEKATLDLIGPQPFFPQAVPGGREALDDEGLHPFQRAWGKDPYEVVREAARLRMGSARYRLRTMPS